jgi:hypothetical protein
VGYYFNDNPECLKAQDLDPDMKWVVMYNGPNAIPTAWAFENNEPIDT